MINIAILKKPQESAISFYRTSPWLDLAREKKYFTLEFHPKAFTPDAARFFDVLICHRPGHINELSAIYVAKKLGIKVIVDLDDLLWQIPIGNEAWRFYDKNADDILSRALINADEITVSTRGLADQVALRFDKNPILLKNAIPPSLFYLHQEPKPFSEDEPIKILWRGSNTHAADLFTYRDAFVNSKRIEWHFFGATPWFFLEEYGGHLPNFVQHTHTTNILDYFDKLREISPDFVIVPLERNEFNWCKSEIAMLEAFLVGAGCIAPAWHEAFSQSEIKFENVDDLKRKIKVPNVTFNIERHSRLRQLDNQWLLTQHERNYTLQKLNLI